MGKRLISVSYEFLEEFLHGNMRRADSNLPIDARITNVHDVFSTQEVAFVMESRQWSGNRNPGDPIEPFTPTYTRNK